MPGPIDLWPDMTDWPLLNRGLPKGVPKAITGECMITFHPTPEEVDQAEQDLVKNWILAQIAGKKQSWPEIALTLKVNGRGRYVAPGVWDLPDGSSNIYVGNSKGVPVPWWAPSCLMGIARAFCLETDARLVQSIHQMLATIVANSIIPVMTSLAEGFNGRPILEIAVNYKEKVFAGKYPNADGEPGPFRLITGEPINIDKDWIKMKM